MNSLLFSCRRKTLKGHTAVKRVRNPADVRPSGFEVVPNIKIEKHEQLLFCLHFFPHVNKHFQCDCIKFVIKKELRNGPDLKLVCKFQNLNICEIVSLGSFFDLKPSDTLYTCFALLIIHVGRWLEKRKRKVAKRRSYVLNCVKLIFPLLFRTHKCTFFDCSLVDIFVEKFRIFN